MPAVANVRARGARRGRGGSDGGNRDVGGSVGSVGIG